MKKTTLLITLLTTSSILPKPYEWNVKNNVIQSGTIATCITMIMTLAALIADDDLPVDDRYTILNPPLFPRFTGAIKNLIGYQKSTKVDCIIFCGLLVPLTLITGIQVSKMIESYKNRKTK